MHAGCNSVQQVETGRKLQGNTCRLDRLDSLRLSKYSASQASCARGSDGGQLHT